MKPVVGITSYAEEVTWGAWVEEAALVPLSYVRAIERAGGRPLVIPPSEGAIEETLAVLDGILFSGGSDLDPALYDAEAHPETQGVHEGAGPRRDGPADGCARARHAGARRVPRARRCSNVARGGDLVQHLPDELGDEEHKHTPGEYSDHDVTLEPGTRVGGLLGDRAPVKSHHHQGFGRIGEGLRTAGYAEDGTVEALEDPSKRFAVGRSLASGGG